MKLYEIIIIWIGVHNKMKLKVAKRIADKFLNKVNG